MAGSQDMKTVVVIVMMLLSVLAVIGGVYFFTQPSEGDECEGKDKNGNYVIDQDGKCTLDYCDTGYYESNGKCKEDKSGDSCEPTGTKDPQGIYLTDQMGLCELTGCNTGYSMVGNTCVVRGSAAASTVAAGGDYIYEHDGYTVHVFNTSGDFVVEESASGTEVECLIVAGGGGGGAADDVNGGGGGGGGGGVLYKTVVVSKDTYPVVVGLGGEGLPDNNGGPAKDGENSSAFNFTAIGGGGGRIGVSGTPENGNSGGSGGGGYRGGTGGAGTPGQGFAGGGTPTGSGSGGGGGAGGAAADQTSPASNGSNGGNGLASSISGSSVTRGGGGGGGANVGPFYTVDPGIEGLGGPGGGGNAGKAAPDAPDPGYPNLPRWTAGGVNLGGGGGGQSSYAGVAQYDAAPGGSGTVIINEPEVDFVDGTSSVWDLRAVFRAVKAGTWTN